MAIKETLEQKIYKTERNLTQLSIHIERLNLDYENVLAELDLTPEQAKEIAENPDFFSAPLWEELQNEKKESDAKLQLALNNVPNPNTTKKVFSERGNIQQHWLFVR